MATARRAPGGRPVTTGRGVRAGRQVLIRMSEDEHRRVAEAAERAGMPVAAWAREQLLRAAR